MGHNVRLHKDPVHLVRHVLAEDFQQGAVGVFKICNLGGRSRLFLDQQLDNVPILRLDALEFFGRAASCEGGVLYKCFVSADMRITEGPGSTHIAHDEDFHLGGGDVGVMVTWEVGLVRHISICSSLGVVLQKVCEMWRGCILQKRFWRLRK